MTSGLDWSGRVGDVWAEQWRRTERSFTHLTAHLDAAIAAVAPRRGRALDIGCGVGSTGLALRAARPELDVVGVDLSPEMLALAGTRAVDVEGRGGALRFVCGDAVSVAASEGPFDLFVSRHGVMFFPDPVAAFTGLRAAASPGAAMVFSCFDERARNGFATLADEAVGHSPAPAAGYEPGPFAFADSHRVGAWLEQAGWALEVAARVDFEYVVGQGAAPIEDAVDFLSRIGPAARAMATAAPDERARIAAALHEGLSHHRTGDQVALPASAWIWRVRAGAA